MSILPIIALLQLMGCSVKPNDNVKGWSCKDEANVDVAEVTGTYQGTKTNSPTDHTVKVGESEYTCKNVRNLAWDRLLAGCNSEYTQ